MKTLGYLLFSLIFYPLGFSALAILASGYIILAKVFRINQEKLSWYVKWGCRIILVCFGQRFQIKGQLPDKTKGPYLFILNHESFFDMLLLGLAVPFYFLTIAADFHFRIFLWKHIAELFGISIKRDSLNQAMVSLSKGEKAILKQKLSLAIFIEGTRTLTGKLGRFKKGPCYVALNTRVPIIMMAIDGAYEAMNLSSWLLKPGKLSLTIAEPVSYADYLPFILTRHIYPPSLSEQAEDLKFYLEKKMVQMLENNKKGGN